MSGLCLVLGCLLAPVSVASVWVNNFIGDTDAYVETVAPIAEQPAVQAALADAVTDVVLENLDVPQLTSDALTTLSELEDMPPRVASALPALAVPISSGIESFTRDQVDKALASPRFATIWAQVNRLAHEQVLRLLEGDQDGVVTAQGDTITLNLGPIVEEVSKQMVDAGFSLAANIPTVDRQFTLVQSEAVTQAQTGYRLLDALGTWLPFVSLVLIAAGVLLARDRWRALLRGALGVTVGMVLLGVALAIARTAYVTTTPADILTPEAAGDVFDLLVRFLRTTLRAVAVLGLVVAVAAFLSGHSPLPSGPGAASSEGSPGCAGAGSRRPAGTPAGSAAGSRPTCARCASWWWASGRWCCCCGRPPPRGSCCGPGWRWWWRSRSCSCCPGRPDRRARSRRPRSPGPDPGPAQSRPRRFQLTWTAPTRTRAMTPTRVSPAIIWSMVTARAAWRHGP